MNGPFGIAGDGPVQRFEDRAALGFLPRGWIDGLILSNDGTDATNDIAISAGACRSTVNIVDGTVSTLTRDQIDLEIPVSIIKQLDVAWAPENYDQAGYSGGDRSGGRSASAVSNATWHVYAIGARGIPADIMLHDSATQSSVLSALPISYTSYRRIGSTVRTGGAIQLFTQTGDYFRIKTPTLDINTTTLSTTATAFALASIPTGLSFRVKLNALLAGTASRTLYVRNPDDTDSAPSGTAAPVCTLSMSGTFALAAQIDVWTNSSAQLSARADGASTTFLAAPIGWNDLRGLNS